MEAILDYIHGNKLLITFTKEELKKFPIKYLIQHVRPWELLEVWHKLPEEYKSNFYLQIRLPCFVHYNRPDCETHVDGPVGSQEDCVLCKRNK